jgi:hypothetical protein
VDEEFKIGRAGYSRIEKRREQDAGYSQLNYCNGQRLPDNYLAPFSAQAGVKQRAFSGVE